MAKISSIKTDLKKAESGVWIPFGSGIELCIASTNTPEFRQARTKLLKPHARLIRAKLLSFEEAINVLKPAYAKHVLVGWKNIEDENGSDIPYSPEKALEFFNDKSLSTLFDFVLETANEEELFRLEDMDDAVKNS